jgi:hypothetical protein
MVCLADLLVMILWVLKLSIFSHRRLSFLEAVRCFRKETNMEKKKERISVLTVVLFVLGPLPQFIKLNACTGVPWTLTWTWIYMLCYFFSALSIVCDRGENEEPHLLRAGTALNIENKALLKRISQRMYILAYTAQLILSVFLVKVSMYTYAVHKFVSTLFGIILWSYLALCLAAGLGYCAIGLLNFCGAAISLVDADPPKGWRRWFAIFIFALLLATNIYWVFWWWKPLLPRKPYFEPFSATSTIAVTIVLVIGTCLGFGLLHWLSARIGPTFIISLQHFPHGRPAPDNPIPLDTQLTRISRQTDSSSGEEEEDPILRASVHFLFAVSVLLLALSYYWQVYDPSDTLKPQWVGVFG